MSSDDTGDQETASDGPSAPRPSDYRDLLRDQWSQSVETSRYIMGLAVQSFGFLIAADALLVGYGLTQDQPEVLWVAAFMPVFMVVTTFLTTIVLSRFVATGTSIERELGLGQAGLMAQFLAGPSPNRLRERQIGGRRVRLFIACGAALQFALALGFSLWG